MPHLHTETYVHFGYHMVDEDVYPFQGYCGGCNSWVTWVTEDGHDGGAVECGYSLYFVEENEDELAYEAALD